MKDEGLGPFGAAYHSQSWLQAQPRCKNISGGPYTEQGDPNKAPLLQVSTPSELLRQLISFQKGKRVCESMWGRKAQRILRATRSRIRQQVNCWNSF